MHVMFLFCFTICKASKYLEALQIVKQNKNIKYLEALQIVKQNKHIKYLEALQIVKQNKNITSTLYSNIKNVIFNFSKYLSKICHLFK